MLDPYVLNSQTLQFTSIHMHVELSFHASILSLLAETPKRDTATGANQAPSKPEGDKIATNADHVKEVGAKCRDLQIPACGTLIEPQWHFTYFNNTVAAQG